MKKYIYIFLTTLLSCFIGCTSKEEPQEASLILEGWIDAGEIPVVLIHRSYVLDHYNEADSAKTIEDIVEDLLIPFGKVTVSDGSNEVVLTGRIDTSYLPPYTYSSLYMSGQVGRSYTVSVDYKQFHVSATTTIPPVAHLDSLRVRARHEEEGDVADVHVFMSGINPKEQAYYALFAREYKKEQFQLCPFGVFESKDAVNGQVEIKLYNPVPDEKSKKIVKNQFSIDPTAKEPQMYQVKIARIDYTSYLFWKAYNEQIMTRGVLFVPVYKNLPGNVNGGKGVFCGMGSSTYRFSLTPDSLYRFK